MSAPPRHNPGEPGTEVMPRRRDRLQRADMGDEQVVYDPERRHSFRLNRTAGLLLDRCDGRTAVPDVVAELAGAFAVEPDQVADQLARVVEVFATDGLVEAPDGRTRALTAELDRTWGPPPPPAGSTDLASDPTSDPSTPPAGRPSGDTSLGLVGAARPVPAWHRVLDVVVAFSSDEADLAQELDRVFGSLPVEPTPPRAVPTSGPGVRLAYHLSRTGTDSVEIRLDTRSVGRANSGPAAMSFVQWHLNREAVAGAVERVLLHAGSVRLGGGRLVLLPGESNAGKSTLVAGLVRAGCGYVTDELVGLAPGTAQATGYRKAISLDPGAWPLFPEAKPTAGAGPLREWLVEPTSLHPGALDGDVSGPVALLVFPRFDAGAVTAATPMSPAEALVELIRHDPSPEPLGSGALDTLAELARRTPAFRMTTGDLEPAVARVLALGGSSSI